MKEGVMGVVLTPEGGREGGRERLDNQYKEYKEYKDSE